jgi:conjugal transfer pilus assembly protein TraW
MRKTSPNTIILQILFFTAALGLFHTRAVALVTLTGSGKRYPVIEKPNHKKMIKKIRKESEKVRKDPQVYTVTLKNPPETAEKESTRRFAATYVQPYDIVNQKGNIIVPKGTKIEPLKYFKLPVLIVVDDDPASIQWAVKKREEFQEKVFILLSHGSAWDVAQKYNIRVYHLDDRFVDRFQIKRVPCIIRQVGLQLEVHEFSL